MRRSITLQSAIVAILLVSAPSVFAQRQFGFDNRKPSGQPYLSPEETVKRFQLADGWEAKLVAGEPDVINPIAFTIDERGRLWVVECFEYPRRTAKGQKPRDRIKIIEETPQGPKVTIWAEGKDLPVSWDLASGIEVGHGGVFLGAPPYLFFLQDTDGDGKCDKQEVLLKGFGSQDTHETLNTFQWGPDSKLYGLHGVFTQSKVGDVRLNAAVWNYDVRAKKFGIYAEGTSNPWGMDFDRQGNCFLACCVIPHLFHMVPGGTYKRQAGTSLNPYAYGLLPEICDHIHHKESGWAHAGLIVLDDRRFPEELRGSLLMGSIHGCSVKRDTLRANGSSFIAGHAPDVLVSGDKNFRPINLRWGPDGSIYLIDWHDQNPCHQAAPDSWDKTRGRIYKIWYKGTKTPKNALPTGDLARLSSADLVDTLSHENPYFHRTALRILGERQDKKVAGRLLDMMKTSQREELALRGLWGLHAIGAFDTQTALQALNHSNPHVRAWAVRLLDLEAGNKKDRVEGMLETYRRLVRLAREDDSPHVRLQLASKAQEIRKITPLDLLHTLMERKEDARDPVIPFMIWLAYEPHVPSGRRPTLDWLRDHAAGNPLVLKEILPRTIRRFVATGKNEDLEACVVFVSQVRDNEVRLRALDGLVNALANRQVQPPSSWQRIKSELSGLGNQEINQRLAKLAINFRDQEAIQAAIKIALDTKKSTQQRVAALRDVGLAHPANAELILLQLVRSANPVAVRVEACRSLAGYDNNMIAEQILKMWKKYPPEVRQEAVNLLAGRRPWAKSLLAAVDAKVVDRRDLTDNTILKIRAFGDKALIKQVDAVWGRYRETPAELLKLIGKMREQLVTTPGSFERGQLVFEKNCSKCHQFAGKGHTVGPNLDGASRDIEYLLANIIDPNRVVGRPYYVRAVELTNGRIEIGLLVAEDPQTITLKMENDVVKVIDKKDIEGKVIVHEKSVMPEGLANNMSPQDLCDLIRYMMVHPFLTHFRVHGPFPAAVDVSALSGAKSARPVTVGVYGAIPVPAGKGTSYYQSVVKTDAPLNTRLLLGGNAPIRVWVNGKQFYAGAPGSKDAEPDQFGLDVGLVAGVTSIVIQVEHRSEPTVLFARFLDPDRKLSELTAPQP